LEGVVNFRKTRGSSGPTHLLRASTNFPIGRHFRGRRTRAWQKQAGQGLRDCIGKKLFYRVGRGRQCCLDW